MTRLLPRIALLAFSLAAASAAADPGMWLYDHFPAQTVKERYGFEPTKEWLEHVRLASVRFNSGGSGSFVSPKGLVMTNHHVGSDCLAKLGSKDHDYHKDGFAAAAAKDEIKCPDLELNVLVDMRDV